MISADEALERLREGNRRFAEGETRVASFVDLARREAVVEEQAPFAVVLGCSDSRVPLELVYDQGVGDLFVIRVAGNIVAPSQIASVEFACEQFGTPLVVVTGHTRCGAVAAAVHAVEEDERPTGNLASIVDRIRPALGMGGDPVTANVRASVAALRKALGSSTRVAGAVYSLETGEVDFL